MTPEAQRIAIAEACGWERTDLQAPGTVGDVQFWVKDGVYCQVEHLPDYLSDLNAMHEAINDLDSLGRIRFVSQVEKQIGLEQVLFASAAELAEAFLRTIGKWEESS